MNWFKNLKTGSKLFVGFGTMIALLGTIVVIAYGGITGIRDSQRKLFEKDLAILEDLLQLRADLNRHRADIERMILSTNRTEQETIEKDIKDRANEAEGIMQKLFEFNQSEPNSLRRLKELEAIRKDYKQARETQIGLIYEGKTEEARKMSVGA